MPNAVASSLRLDTKAGKIFGNGTLIVGGVPQSSTFSFTLSQANEPSMGTLTGATFTIKLNSSDTKALVVSTPLKLKCSSVTVSWQEATPGHIQVTNVVPA